MNPSDAASVPGSGPGPGTSPATVPGQPSPALTVLVSRHPGAIAWMRQVLDVPDAPVITHLDALAGLALGPGVRLAGVLPLRWAAAACAAGAEVWSLDVDVQEAQRGRELSVADLEAAGARLVRYQVVAR